MALVASLASNVWRDPNVMSASQVTASLTTAASSSPTSDSREGMECKPLLPLPPNLISNITPDQEAGISSHANTPSTPSDLLATIPSQSSSSMSQGSDGESSSAIVKDENGHEIACVVCTDKSSGKHYGQFTCEGNIDLV